MPRLSVARLRRILYARGCTALPTCPQCGRLTELRDWHPVVNSCRECVLERDSVTWDDDGFDPESAR